jgi:hypothetical protein
MMTAAASAVKIAMDVTCDRPRQRTSLMNVITFIKWTGRHKSQRLLRVKQHANVAFALCRICNNGSQVPNTG